MRRSKWGFSRVDGAVEKLRTACGRIASAFDKRLVFIYLA
jgi:hypothetical protein